MFDTYSVSRVISSVITLLLLALAVGAIFDAVFEALFIAALALLVWHYSNIHRVNKYLWYSRRFAPPEGKGSWAPVFDGIYRLQQRNLDRRHQLGALVKRFREGAEALPDAAVVLGPGHVIAWCNSLSEDLLGLRWPDDRGLRIDNLLRHPEFGRFIRARTHDEPLVMPSHLNQGRMLEFRLMPYGRSQRLLIVRDVTRTIQLERMRQDFVANVSHELRTPLTVIRGYLEMAEHKDALSDEMWTQACRMMTEQANRMESLVLQLTELSTIESVEKLDLSAVINVSELLGIIEREANTLIADGDLKLTFDVDPKLIMYGDSRQMRSAFSNLIFNAVKYTPEPGNIQVRWKRVKEGARFSVRDDGEGIEPRHLARLTERFYRIDKARSRKSGGSGLGLAIVKHTLNNHQSSLEIKSELGKGSCFSFVIDNKLLAPVEKVLAKR